MKRHKPELKWIKNLQPFFPLGINYNIYREGNISKMPYFDIFLFWNVVNVKLNLMVNEITATFSAKFVLTNA